MPRHIHVELEQLKEWKLNRDKKSIQITFKMKSFNEALELIGVAGKLAERHQHHPDIYLISYRYLTFVLTTHAIKGLSMKDFILASKISQISKSLG